MFQVSWLKKAKRKHSVEVALKLQGTTKLLIQAYIQGRCKITKINVTPIQQVLVQWKGKQLRDPRGKDLSYLLFKINFLFLTLRTRLILRRVGIVRQKQIQHVKIRQDYVFIIGGGFKAITKNKVVR